MMRSATILASSLFLVLGALGACGGGGSGDDDDDDTVTPDAGLPNSGFVAPDHVTEATDADGNAVDVDWSCLGTPSDDAVPTAAIDLTGVINDFQNMDNEVREATVEVFPGIDIDTVVDTAGPTDNTGAYALTLTPGTNTRWGFKVTATDYMPTYLLNQYFDAAGGAQTRNISAISNGVATALPAIIGLQRIPGTGVLAGAMRDCAGHEVSYAVGTVSATAGEPDHLDGAVTYYLDAGAGLPVGHDLLNRTDVNGLFAVFQLPATAVAYVQVWGFVDAADLADGEMTLLAELPAPVVGDTVVTGSIEPLRTN